MTEDDREQPDFARCIGLVGERDRELGEVDLSLPARRRLKTALEREPSPSTASFHAHHLPHRGAEICHGIVVFVAALQPARRSFPDLRPVVGRERRGAILERQTREVRVGQTGVPAALEAGQKPPAQAHVMRLNLVEIAHVHVLDRDRVTLGLIALAGHERDTILARVRERTISARMAEQVLSDACNRRT